MKTTPLQAFTLDAEAIFPAAGGWCCVPFSSIFAHPSLIADASCTAKVKRDLDGNPRARDIYIVRY